MIDSIENNIQELRITARNMDTWIRSHAETSRRYLHVVDPRKHTIEFRVAVCFGVDLKCTFQREQSGGSPCDWPALYIVDRNRERLGFRAGDSIGIAAKETIAFGSRPAPLRKMDLTDSSPKDIEIPLNIQIQHTSVQFHLLRQAARVVEITSQLASPEISPP